MIDCCLLYKNQNTGNNKALVFLRGLFFEPKKPARFELADTVNLGLAGMLDCIIGMSGTPATSCWCEIVTSDGRGQCWLKNGGQGPDQADAAIISNLQKQQSPCISAGALFYMVRHQESKILLNI